MWSPKTAPWINRIGSTDSYQQAKHGICFGPIIALPVNAILATSNVASDLDHSEIKIIEKIKTLRDPFQITHTTTHGSPRDPDQRADPEKTNTGKETFLLGCDWWKENVGTWAIRCW